MIKNYFKIVIRNIWKHKTFTFINIAGMAVAFGAVLLLVLTAVCELSFDRFHTNKDAIFQLYFEEHHAADVRNNSSMAVPITPALKMEFPDIVHLSRYGENGGSVVRYRNKDFNYDLRYADADFFKMFTFPIVSGNVNNPLNDQNDVVLSAKVAKNIFGAENPINKVISLKINNKWKAFNVSAVASDVPENSTLGFGLVCRFEQYPDYEQTKDDWYNMSHNVFVQLPPNETAAAFDQKLKTFTHKFYDKSIKDLKHDGAHGDAEGEVLRMHLIPLTEMHFSSISSAASAVNKFYPYLVLLVSIFILFIACTNFVNLSLGRAFTRAKEIGVRKVIGATKSQLIIQFCSESLIICAIALLLGAVAAYLVLPQYKTLFTQQLSLTSLRSPLVIIYFLVGFIVISMLAGGYPAWLMAVQNTAQTVKGKLTSGKSNRLRNTLMVVQFVLSGLLIICTAITWQQLTYMRNKPLGYDKNHVVSIPIGSNIEPEKALTEMRLRLAPYPNVISVTGTDINLGRGLDNSSSTSVMSFKFKGKTIRTNWLRVDYDYIKTLGLQLVKGRDFSKTYGADTAVVLINQKMADQLGEKDPIGAVLPTDGTNLKVAGVVKDYNYKSLHNEIDPLTMVVRTSWPVNYILVKVNPADIAGSRSLIDKTWKDVNPKAESGLSFLDENTERQYQKETRLSKIFITGAVMAIVISCMGLFAMVILVIAQRTKEIGIRKVLGASVSGIVVLLSADFLKLVLLAILISSPVAWWVMDKWLQGFAYQVPLHWWVFVLAGLFAAAIALVTISFQAIKAALTNPVKSLRSE